MDCQQRLSGRENTKDWLVNAQRRRGEDWVGILHELVPKLPLPPATQLRLVTNSAPTGGFVTKVEGLDISLELSSTINTNKKDARREASRSACLALVELYPEVQLLHKLVVPCPWRHLGRGCLALLRPHQIGEHWIMAHRPLFRQSISEGPEQVGDLSRQTLLEIFSADEDTGSPSILQATQVDRTTDDGSVES